MYSIGALENLIIETSAVLDRSVRSVADSAKTNKGIPADAKNGIFDDPRVRKAREIIELSESVAQRILNDEPPEGITQRLALLDRALRSIDTDVPPKATTRPNLSTALAAHQTHIAGHVDSKDEELAVTLIDEGISAAIDILTDKNPGAVGRLQGVVSSTLKGFSAH